MTAFLSGISNLNTQSNFPYINYMKVLSVKPLPEYQLNVASDDGVSGTVDLKGFIEKGIFSVLKDAQAFNKVYTKSYAIAWSDELEIDALTVYAEISGKKPEEMLIA
jgi:hypothetical protein